MLIRSKNVCILFIINSYHEMLKCVCMQRVSQTRLHGGEIWISHCFSWPMAADNRLSQAGKFFSDKTIMSKSKKLNHTSGYD